VEKKYSEMRDGETIKDRGIIIFGRRSSSALFFGMLLVLLLVSVIAIINAMKWVNKPFPGFLINERMLVAPIGQYNWSGTQAGLKYPEKILSVNGNPVSSPRELEDIIQGKPIGSPIEYRIERKGEVLKATLKSMRFSVVDLVMTFGINFIGGIAYLLIGLVVYILKPDTKTSWAFLLASFFLSMWQLTVFDMQSTHLGFIRLYLFANAFFPAAFVHFSFYFPEPNRLIQKHPAVQFLPYLVSLIIVTPMELFYPKDAFKPFYAMAFYYMVVGILIVLYPMVVAYFKSASALSRQRARVVLIGATVAFFIPGLAYFSQMFFGSFLGIRVQTNFLIPLLTIFPASIAYAVVKHNLFDVDVYIKRALGYGIMTAIIIGAYALLSVTFNVLMGRYEIAQSKVFPILFTIGVIFVFNPLRNRIQVFVDRVFFRKDYDYGEIIDRIGGAITSLLDLGQVLGRLTQTFIEDMFIDTTSVMLLNPATAEYRVYLADGERKRDVEGTVFKRDDPLMQIMEEKKRELTKYDVLEDPKYKTVSESCAANFEALHSSIMVPLVFQDQLIGTINLGEKKSGKFYNREDIDLLYALANQGAVAIENARLFQENLEKQRMEEELNIARDLQMSMLPVTCPEIKGFKIAASSTPAREVGGDFYDFIEMGKDRAGFVVGDVTGKSVSGALVMSSSRSVFRMLSEEQLSVGDIMIRANRRIKKDITSGMFVALLYAVLDGKERVVSLCSAGQTQPIYSSLKTDEAVLVETKGDNFPLGILDEADYKETQLQLEAGDKVVFYTDGIVEAMNKQEEMFGFDRLLEVVKGARSLSADSLLKEIIDRVNEFAGDVAQHDDLTVIVVSVEE
jgi:serine phosphatase RsbU (regulator of sigma subunit)